VIDSIYGLLSGRDESVYDQMLKFVDIVKEHALETTIHYLHPNAWKESDDHPQNQIPHLLSSYKVAIGASMGFRGIESAKADKNRVKVSSKIKKKVESTVKVFFSIGEIIDLIIKDVNQNIKCENRILDLDL